MEQGESNKDRLPHDCMDAGGRVTQEQLPRDVAVEQPWQELFLTILLHVIHPWLPDASFARLDLTLPVPYPDL